MVAEPGGGRPRAIMRPPWSHPTSTPGARPAAAATVPARGRRARARRGRARPEPPPPARAPPAVLALLALLPPRPGGPGLLAAGRPGLDRARGLRRSRRAALAARAGLRAQRLPPARPTAPLGAPRWRRRSASSPWWPAAPSRRPGPSLLPALVVDALRRDAGSSTAGRFRGWCMVGGGGGAGAGLRGAGLPRPPRSRRCGCRWRVRGAIGLSAVAFAAVHLDPVRFPALLFLGVLYGWLSWRTGSVWPSVLAHAVNNAAATALAVAWPEASEVGRAGAGRPGPLAALAASLALTAPLVLAYQRTMPPSPSPEAALVAARGAGGALAGLGGAVGGGRCGGPGGHRTPRTPLAPRAKGLRRPPGPSRGTPVAGRGTATNSKWWPFDPGPEVSVPAPHRPVPGGTARGVPAETAGRPQAAASRPIARFRGG